MHIFGFYDNQDVIYVLPSEKGSLARYLAEVSCLA